VLRRSFKQEEEEAESSRFEEKEEEKRENIFRVPRLLIFYDREQSLDLPSVANFRSHENSLHIRSIRCNAQRRRKQE